MVLQARRLGTATAVSITAFFPQCCFFFTSSAPYLSDPSCPLFAAIYLLFLPFLVLAILMRHAHSQSFSRWLAHHFGIISFTSAFTPLLVLSTFDTSLYTPCCTGSFSCCRHRNPPKCRTSHARHAHAAHLNSGKWE